MNSSNLVSRLSNAMEVGAPFPVVQVSDFFDADLFEQILAHWPDEGFFTAFPETGRVPRGRYEQRKVCVLNTHTFNKLDSNPLMLWQKLKINLADRSFANSLFKLLSKGESTTSTELPASAEVDLILAEDYHGYEIGPHTDSPSKIFSALIYIDASSSSLGTSIYTPKGRRTYSASNTHYKKGAFVEIERLSFVPNKLAAFLRTDNSFHGVEPMSNSSGFRRLIIYTCYERGIPTYFKEEYR